MYLGWKKQKFFVDQTLNKRLQKKLFNQYLRLSRWDERRNKRFSYGSIPLNIDKLIRKYLEDKSCAKNPLNSSKFVLTSLMYLPLNSFPCGTFNSLFSISARIFLRFLHFQQKSSSSLEIIFQLCKFLMKATRKIIIYPNPRSIIIQPN